MKEDWKDIKDYESLYQVSNLGRVKSLRNNKSKKEKILKPGNNRGYLYVPLYKEGKRKIYAIHRLVSEAFIENPNNFPCVNHKDENPSNNCVENLEWCSREYNNNYGTRNQRVSENHADFSGSKHPKARKVQCITTGKKFNCIKEAGEYYYIDSYHHITNCCTGKRNYCGKHPVTGEKLVWKYIDS